MNFLQSMFLLLATLPLLFGARLSGGFALATAGRISALSPANDAPCTSNVVNDYTADPTGVIDSTSAFVNALNATPQPGAVKGNVVCVPPGTYLIGSSSGPHDITIVGPYSSNGGALLGPSEGVATILQNDSTSNILDSCPLTNGATDMPIPSACNSLPFGASNAAQNWRIENITLSYVTQPAPISGSPQALNGWAPSAIYFPSVSGLEVHNVIFNNAWDCYDFGSSAGNATGIAVVEGTSSNSCAGHLLAFHGAAANISVVRQTVKGGRGTSSLPFQAITFDTSDVGANAVANLNFLEDDWEGSAFGNLIWLADGTTLTDFSASGNICDNFTFGCYLFVARPNQSGSSQGASARVTVQDKWGTSWYSPLQFDGGGYTGATGVGSIQVNSGLFAAGGGPIGGSSLFFIGGVPASGGYSVDGSAIGIQFPAHGTSTASPWFITTAIAGDNARTLVQRFINSYGCEGDPTSACSTPQPSGPDVNIGTTYLANPNYAPIGMNEHTSPPIGVYVDHP